MTDDAGAEVGLEGWIVAALGGYQVLGPSARHPTVWYRDGLFADDRSWDIQRGGRGGNAGSVVCTLRGSLLARLPDRGLASARALLDLLGLDVRRVDVMAEAPRTPGVLWELYELLRTGAVRLPRGLTFDYRDHHGRERTLYLGSTSSDEYVCLYDRRGVDRVEVRGKGQVGEDLARALLAGGDARGVVCERLRRYGPLWGTAPGRALLGRLRAGD